MPANDPFTDPTDADLEMIADSTHIAGHGHPLKRPAAQGVADMRARIALLKENKKNILDQIEANPVKYGNDVSFKTGMDRTLAEIESELHEAQERLREYQAQQKGLN